MRRWSSVGRCRRERVAREGGERKLEVAVMGMGVGSEEVRGMKMGMGMCLAEV